MTDLGALLGELLAVEARLRADKHRAGELRAQLVVEARELLAQTGAAPTWRVKGVGAVSLVVPEPRWEVLDDEALVDYVIRDLDEPEWTVRRVDPLIAERLVREAAENGEKLPGVELVEKLPYLRITVDR